MSPLRKPNTYPTLLGYGARACGGPRSVYNAGIAISPAVDVDPASICAPPPAERLKRLYDDMCASVGGGKGAPSAKRDIATASASPMDAAT